MPILLDVEAHLEELPSLVVSIFVLFAIVFLGRMILESKRAQELVQRSRDYAESIVDTVRAPLLVLDGELRVILAGNSFYQNFGVTPEEAEGRLLFDLGDKQWDIPRLRELLKQVLPKNTKVEDFEVEHEIPKIGRRIMLLNAQRMYRRENKTQMILLTIEDITERKQAVQRLRDSEARLAGAQRLAKLGYWGWELDNAAISFHTDVLADVFGTPPDQMPTTVDEYCRWIHPDDVERMAKHYEVVAKENQNYTVDYRIIRPDGETRYIHEIGVPIHDDLGKLVEYT